MKPLNHIFDEACNIDVWEAIRGWYKTGAIDKIYVVEDRSFWILRHLKFRIRAEADDLISK